MIAAFNGRTRIIEVLWGQNSVEDLGAETWVKLEIPMVFSIFLVLLFETIVGWFSFIQLVSTFYGYVFYIKWSSKSVAFLGDIFSGLDLGWHMVLPRFLGYFKLSAAFFIRTINILVIIFWICTMIYDLQKNIASNRCV